MLRLCTLGPKAELIFQICIHTYKLFGTLKFKNFFKKATISKNIYILNSNLVFFIRQTTLTHIYQLQHQGLQLNVRRWILVLFLLILAMV